MRLLIDAATRPNGPISAIDRVAVSEGRFVIVDKLNNETKHYDGLQLSLEKAGGGTNFDLSAQGPNGPWSISARAAGQPNSDRRLDFDFKNITVDEISLVSGARDIGADFDMPLSSHLTVALDAKGQLTDVDGKVHFDPGYLRFDDPNDEPRLIDTIDAAFHWDGSERRIDIDGARVKTGDTDSAMHGAIAAGARRRCVVHQFRQFRSAASMAPNVQGEDKSISIASASRGASRSAKTKRFSISFVLPSTGHTKA